MARKPSIRKTAAPSVLANTVRAELTAAGDRNIHSREAKQRYAVAFSTALATRFANALRPVFDGIFPDENGKNQESQARTSKGYKKLDVNYSTPQLGLGLGVSIKTINFRDGDTKRYTKNYTRVDGELRAEASDYHVRQPYAVMVAVIFLPLDACDDAGKSSPSSFGGAVQLFRPRSGRDEPEDEPMLFERVYIGLYDTRPETMGEVIFFDVREPPPKSGTPKSKSTLSFADVIDGIVNAFDERNSPPFIWDDGDVDENPVKVEDVEGDGLEE